MLDVMWCQYIFVRRHHWIGASCVAQAAATEILMLCWLVLGLGLGLARVIRQQILFFTITIHPPIQISSFWMPSFWNFCRFVCLKEKCISGSGWLRQILWHLGCSATDVRHQLEQLIQSQPPSSVFSMISIWPTFSPGPLAPDSEIEFE